ncbi:hypothetical protein [Rickettsiella endosymbiont of Dermanyssus gallinae]|uniref:hypothetical protein n=1 Tax=Rickettsiella endosymbiont of Dermanyssus gallinae TaxID=2856608 RepID=UPI001C5303BF|nr:hypothetical protein [Rickettsiella endosymbiont of Dermanyssus gallinae]
MANFYKAMAIDQNYFPIREKIKVIVIEMGKAILPTSRGKLKTIIMNREEYKKSNKSDHLITIAINNSGKQKLRDVIADSLDNFDRKNLNDIIDFLGQKGFAFYKEDNLDVYLNDELILLKKLKLNDDQGKAFDVINNKISELQNWAKKYRNSSEGQFHGNVEIDKELDELQLNCAEYTIEKDNAGLNAVIERFNKIRVSFSLDGLDFLHRTLTNLQSRFIGIQPEVGNLQQAMQVSRYAPEEFRPSCPRNSFA